MKIIPAIDLIEGKTVRLEQGRYDRKLSYEISPVDAACKWATKGAELIHVVDLDGAREGRPVNLTLLEEIVRAARIPVEVGGGFRQKEDIQKALDKGVFRVVVGSKVLEDFSFAQECIKDFGAKVIFSVDVKGSSPSVRGWKKTIDMDVATVLERFVDFGLKEIIYTDIKSDGTLAGPNVDGLKRILEETDLKVISAGGVKTVDHIRDLKKLENMGLSGVIIGRALYEGTIELEEAISVGKTDNTVS